MSSILALAGPAAQAATDREVEKLMGSMRFRGGEVLSIARSGPALVATGRDPWEPGSDSEAAPGAVARGGYRIAADASLYFTRDLEERLRRAGTTPVSSSAADLIVAAYAAFGPRCVDLLEGDYAFCLWDEEARTLFCARDPFGSRSLFHTAIDGTLAVASTPAPLVEWRGGAAFDPIGVLRSLLMRYGDGTSTAWSGIHELPAGHSLLFTPGCLTTERFWAPRGSDRWRALRPAEAVAALRDLLQEAARERLVPGRTALAMSGGLDSTSLAASLAASGARPPDVLSFKLAADDPGNEDWYVERMAAAYELSVRWVETGPVGLYADAFRHARRRSHCHGHVFEGHNRALARAAAGMGEQVLINGHGGDNVMAVGNWMMADLLRRGRLLELWRYRAARGYRGWRQLVDQCLRPALPLPLFDGLERVLGRTICTRPHERPVPHWVVPPAEAIAEIVHADREYYDETIVRPHRTVTEQRRAWALMDGGFTRACAALFDLTRDEGVELRMPFYDRRLVEFAMSRPAPEFNQPNRYKVLLQEAMKDRLPSRSRAPQPGGLKSGTAVGLMRTRWPVETLAIARELSAQPWISEELGIVDRGRFMDQVERTGALHWHSAVDVSLTLFVEIWLRAQLSPSGD